MKLLLGLQEESKALRLKVHYLQPLNHYCAKEDYWSFLCLLGKKSKVHAQKMRFLTDNSRYPFDNWPLIGLDLETFYICGILFGFQNYARDKLLIGLPYFLLPIAPLLFDDFYCRKRRSQLAISKRK